MKTLARLWLFAALLLCRCTYNVVETEPADMPLRDQKTDSGILDQGNPTLIGKTYNIAPGNVDPSEVAKAVITRDFQTNAIVVAADVERNTQIVTLAVDAFQLDFPQPTEEEAILVQGVLRFGTGTAQSGQPASTGALQPITSEILFDVQSGAMISFPASSLSFFIRYTAVARAAPFVAGHAVGPSYAINVSLSYGDKTKTLGSTKTDPFQNLLAAATSTKVFRAPYARALQVTWKEYSGTGSAGPVDLLFNNIQNVTVGSMRIAPAVAGTPFLPPPIIPWPAGAQGVSVANRDGANPITFVTVQQFLDL